MSSKTSSKLQSELVYEVLDVWEELSFCISLGESGAIDNIA